MLIRPIETRYRGYRFRSRLEARWAVFFDTAKIRWDYEVQGYDVNGRAYLPDFYLPDLRCYFEVKPTSEYDLGFLQSFAYAIKTHVVVAEGGIPDPEEWRCDENTQLRLLSCTSPEEPSDEWVDEMAWGYKDMFLECNHCGKIRIMNEVYCTMKDNCSCNERHARWMPISRALEAARAARFEHGECG